MLGTLGGDLIWPLLERIAAGDGKGAIAESERIAAAVSPTKPRSTSSPRSCTAWRWSQAGVEPAPTMPMPRASRAMAGQLDAGTIQVMYQIAVLGRRDLALAPDEYAGFTMTVLRMLSFVAPQARSQAAARAAGTFERSCAPAARAAAPSRPQPCAPAVAAPQPADSQPAPAARPAVSFDGDWPGLVQRLNLTGLAGMVARTASSCRSRTTTSSWWCPRPTRCTRRRRTRTSSRRAAAAFRLDPAPHGEGRRDRRQERAAERSREQARRQASAAEAIEDDPFVRELVRDLGAEVVSSSIRPADDAAGPSNER
jgi:DNA polymerase-3 subunit gamma/tau